MPPVVARRAGRPSEYLAESGQLQILLHTLAQRARRPLRRVRWQRAALLVAAAVGDVGKRKPMLRACESLSPRRMKNPLRKVTHPTGPRQMASPRRVPHRRIP